jgi:hypothetical protein
MRQIVAVIILIALFALLVGSRFKPSDGEKLSVVSRLAYARIRGALPPSEKIAGPVQALRRELPERVEDRVKARLETDKRLEGIGFTITVEGATVKLQGVVPDEAARKRAAALAENTTGVEAVVNELAVPQ